ncbi:MAG: hypothetical protein EOO54_04750 [Haliea sp.]|nr:MAG: hypothetical protein EOO54_04750 [Haliea sp.]
MEAPGGFTRRVVPGEPMSISASVGRAGVNRFADVVTVQGMLNEAPVQGRTAPLAVDGLVGPKTIACILLFQKQSGKIQDGRIDANGPTLKALAGTDPDLPWRAIARAVVAICDDVHARLPPVGLPVNNHALLRLRRELANSGRSLRGYLPVSNSVSSGTAGFIGFPMPVFPLVQVGGVLIVLQALLILIGATMLIMLLQALAPRIGPAASKLAMELQARRDVLAATLTEAAVQVIIFINEVRAKIDRCKPQGNLNNAGECKRAIDNALRILRNMEFKLDALKRLVFKKMPGSAVPDLTDFRNARQLVAELMDHVTEMQSAIKDVMSKCQCHFVVG